MATGDTRPEPFFVRLRRLAVHVEKETSMLETAVEERDRDCCVPVVIKTINDMTHDLKDVKQKAQDSFVTLKSNIDRLENLLSLGDRLLTQQDRQISKTEDYLKQYGYVKWEEHHGQRETVKQVTSQTHTSSDTVDANHGTNIPGTPPVPSSEMSREPARPAVIKTPTLEGRQISKNTMQFLNSISKNKAPTWAAASMHAGNRKSQTPQDFQHRGIIVTPSLLGDRVNYNDYSMMNAHEALATPIPPVSDTPTTFEPDIKDPVLRLQFDSVGSESPVAPVFITPMFKTMFENNSQQGDGDVKQAHNKKALFQNEPNREVNRATFTKGFVKNEPQTPELTYSLEEMSEMTGMFSFKPTVKLPKAPSPPLLSVGTTLDNRPTPEEPDLLSQRLAKIPKKNDILLQNMTVVPSEHTRQHNKENVALEEPKHQSHIGVQGEPDNVSVKKVAQYGDQPPSPKFLGQYSFKH